MTDSGRPEGVTERRIREAVERGEFRNLPGQGRPLDLDSEATADREHWASNHVLKNAGMLPGWIELAKDIDELQDQVRAIEADHERWIGATRESLARGPLADRRAGIESIQRRYLARYGRQVDELKAKVDRFNLIVPARFLEKLPVVRDRYLDRLRTPYRSLVDPFGWPEVAPPPITRFDDEVGIGPERLFDDLPSETIEVESSPDEREVREHILQLNRRLRSRSSRFSNHRGLPLEWLASLNPLSHAADLLRARKQEADSDDD